MSDLIRQKADRRSESRAIPLGCGDGSCLFGRPTGMHTNGGCRCFRRDFETAQSNGHQMAGIARDLAADVERLTTEVEAWRKGNPSDDLWRVRMEQAEALLIEEQQARHAAGNVVAKLTLLANATNPPPVIDAFDTEEELDAATAARDNTAAWYRARIKIALAAVASIPPPSPAGASAPASGSTPAASSATSSSSEAAGNPSAPHGTPEWYWRAPDAEHAEGPHPTREEAIADAKATGYRKFRVGRCRHLHVGIGLDVDDVMERMEYAGHDEVGYDDDIFGFVIDRQHAQDALERWADENIKVEMKWYWSEAGEETIVLDDREGGAA